MVILFLVSVLPTCALSFVYVTPRLGVIFIANAVRDSASFPILNTFGSSMTFEFEHDNRLSLDPGIDFYWTLYEWSTSGDRAIPTEPETLESAFVPTLLIDLPISYRFPLSDRFSLKPGIGLAMAIRAAFPGSDSISGGDVGKIGAWFYEAARFVYPELQVLADYQLQDRLAFQFGVRTLWPLFNVWTGEDFFDQWSLQIALSMRISIR
jgi:hypothetical protein